MKINVVRVFVLWLIILGVVVSVEALEVTPKQIAAAQKEVLSELNTRGETVAHDVEQKYVQAGYSADLFERKSLRASVAKLLAEELQACVREHRGTKNYQREYGLSYEDIAVFFNTRDNFSELLENYFPPNTAGWPENPIFSRPFSMPEIRMIVEYLQKHDSQEILRKSLELFRYEASNYTQQYMWQMLKDDPNNPLAQNVVEILKSREQYDNANARQVLEIAIEKGNQVLQERMMEYITSETDFNLKARQLVMDLLKEKYAYDNVMCLLVKNMIAHHMAINHDFMKIFLDMLQEDRFVILHSDMIRYIATKLCDLDAINTNQLVVFLKQPEHHKFIVMLVDNIPCRFVERYEEKECFSPFVDKIITADTDGEIRVAIDRLYKLCGEKSQVQAEMRRKNELSAFEYCILIYEKAKEESAPEFSSEKMKALVREFFEKSRIEIAKYEKDYPEKNTEYVNQLKERINKMEAELKSMEAK